MSADVVKSDFWSRRRAAVVAEEEAAHASRAAEDVARAEADLEAKTDDDILAEYDLPDPDTLETPEDIRDFLSKAPLQRLKTRALRRMWRLNPVLANLDGLLDYGEDFTDSAMVIENMQTAYQVGKGMLRHIEALAEAEAAKEAEAETTAQGAEGSVEDEATDAAAEVADATDVQELDAHPAGVGEDAPQLAQAPMVPASVVADDVAHVQRPRRMTFTFQDQRI